MRFLSVIILTGSFFLGACATSLQPKDGAQTLIEAESLLEKQSYEESHSLYLQTLHSSGDRLIQSRSLYGLSLIAREKKDYRAHISYLERAFKLDPEKYIDELAKAYWRYGNAEDKANARDMFIDLSKIVGAANKYLAQMAFEDGDVEKSRFYYQEGIRLTKQRYRLKGDPTGRLALELARLNYYYDGVQKNCANAEPWYREAITKGQMDAAYELATLWQTCEGYKRSLQDIFTLMIQAAERGHVKAMRYVADAYMNGNGVTANTDTALEWYKKLGPDARRKDMERIADDLMFGKGASESDQQKALQYYIMAASKGSYKGALIAAAYGRNLPSLPEEELMEAASRLEKSHGASHKKLIWNVYSVLADQGIPAAVFWKARAYELGEYTKKDTEQSKIWYEKAAKAGSPEAYLYAARLNIVDDNPEALKKAFENYHKAAALGNVEGQYQTGLMYARGLGVEKDLEKAREWLKKAEKNGYVLATQTLSSLLGKQK